jgi:hypothetical protein
MRKHSLGSAIGALAIAIVATAPAHAQETTSSITGEVASDGVAVAGAKVVITHLPSGTRSVVTTDASGAYSAHGLRIGGPYTVEVSASGYSDATVTDVYTVLGQSYTLPVDMVSDHVIVVTASKVRGARTISKGPSTVLTSADIAKVASTNRDIRDLMRRDPFATLDTSSTTGRNVTFAGQNPRFNRFTIDGVPITDSFGLNPDGLPSRRGPVPFDSIGQFETKVAPYDIREGFFEGGVVNAVLRSGTNEFQGTGFYSFTNDGLTGDRTKAYITNPTGHITQPNFSSKDFGVELSGPIIKDKLFFMVAAERVRASLPVPFGTEETNAGTPIVGLHDAQLAQITNISKSRYGVDAGGILTNNGDKDDRVVAKINANLSDTQRVSLTGIYTKDSLNTPGSTASNALSTLSDDYVKPNRVFGGVLQWNSDWNSRLSTETRIRYKDYKSGQTPILANTAMATICTDPGAVGAITTGVATTCSANVPTVIVGPQTSSQANALRVKTFGASELLTYLAGNHSIKLFGEFENSKNYDLFINGANGSYYFDSIEAYNEGIAQNFSYTNATTGNQNDAAAKFTYQTYTLGLQDDWKVSRELNLSFGIRYDLYGSGSRPPVNPFFADREGFSNDSFIDGRQLFQPRFGFDYKPMPRLSIHGGGGIFGGGTPDVYVANSFSSSGVQPASFSVSTAGSPYLNNVSLTQTPAGVIAQLKGSTTASTSAIDPHFKIPSQWRATVSATYDADLGPLGDHWLIGADLLVSKVRDAIFVQDYRDRPSGQLTPDGRQRYNDVVTGASIIGGADPFGDYVLTNTSKGRTFVGVTRFEKAWDFGLDIGGSFTYQKSKDLQALTSSVASSNYNNGAYLDANGGAYGHSNDEVRYSFKYSLTYQHAFYRDYKTTFSLFGETRIGSPYSYTFQDPTASGNNRSSVFGTVGANTHYLFYVPKVNDPLVQYADAATQAAVENLINSTDLKKYRGQIAPRNAFNSKWFTKLDLHLEQEIPTFLGHSRIHIFADIENFLNLINHDWGQQLRANFPYYKSVVQVSCVTVGANSCAQYKYSSPTTAANLADQLVTANGSSLYSIRIGARVSF